MHTMHHDVFRLALLSSLLVLAGAFGLDAPAAEVMIYRCTDGQGRVTLRDTPCAKGQQQQAREMLRPKDPRNAPRAPAATAPASSNAATTAFVVVRPPRPLYECIAPDGQVYTSDSGQGERRWEPVWIGYPRPYTRNRGHHDGFPTVARSRTSDGRPAGLVFDNVGRPTAHAPRDRSGVPRHGYPTAGVVYGAGAWVRDECHPLPQQEVCARLRDRRYELDRRYHSALQGERAMISEEQRGIDARLATDCGVD